MGAYTYTALNSAGKTVRDMIEGDTERHVRNQLRARNLKPLDVKNTRQSKVTEAAEGPSLTSLLRRQPRLNSKELSLLTRQLASLVLSGLPLDEALHTAAQQSTRANAKSILLQVRSKVLEGHSLHQALSEHPRSFDHMYRAMVRAGESAGYLGQVMAQLAEYIERSQFTQQKVKMAMIYPLVLVGVSFIVIGVLMAFVVPNLVGMFEHSSHELPLLTRALIASSDAITSYGLYALVVMAVAFYGLRRWLQEPNRRRRWHRIKLKLPVFGEVLLQADSARFAGTLSLLTSSGVPLLQALQIATQVLSNQVLQEASKAVTQAVQEGGSFSKALRQSGWFPPLLVQMAASGEANGTLSEQLQHCAKNQERELEMMIGTTMGLLEPIMILFMGGMVTLIVLAILLPIFQMNSFVG